MIMTKTAQFRELTFPSETELDQWLKETTFKTIYFEDLGQDLQRMWVHKSGEILHCDYHSRIYSGKFVDLEALIIGKPLKIWDNDNQRFDTYHKLCIDNCFEGCEKN